MITIKITITGGFSDCYIYCGHIFFAGIDGNLSYMSWRKLISYFKERNPKLSPLFDLFFLRNDYMSTTSAKTVLAVPNIRNQLIREWQIMAKAGGLSIDFDEIKDELTHVDIAPIHPLLDMRIYNMKILLGSANGLHELSINPDERFIEIEKKVEKKFDGKVINIAASYGTLALSAANDGLISGSWKYEDSDFYISERSVVNGKSMRASWAGYNIVNYDSARSFEFLRNETGTVEQDNDIPYYFREKRETKRIVGFGTKKIDSTAMFDKSKIKSDDIAFCFNSKETAYFFLKNGRFIRQNFKTEDDNVRLSTREIEIDGPNKRHRFSKPLSSVIIPNGCAVEFFDEVIVFKNNRAYVIEDEPIMGMRSFMTSSRYHYLLAISKESGVSIHSLYPFDTMDNINIQRRIATPVIGKAFYSSSSTDDSDLPL